MKFKVGDKVCRDDNDAECYDWWTLGKAYEVCRDDALFVMADDGDKYYGEDDALFVIADDGDKYYVLEDYQTNGFYLAPNQASETTTKNDTSTQKLTEIRKVLGLVEDTEKTHARHNLLGVLCDLEYGRNDRICWQTIRRVAQQLADVETILEND